MQNRRTFLKTAAAAVLAPALLPPKKLLLAFSTLGCPGWTLDQVLACAVTNRYQGVELRGIKGELDLPKCPDLSSPERINATRQKLVDKNVSVVNLGSSANLHFVDPKKRTDQLDHAKRFIDLAQELNCPFVRVFPNDLPPDQDRAQTLDLITSGLAELGDHARNGRVSVLLESHGKVIESPMLRQIMTGANRPNVGLIWDIVNMWSVTKEPLAEVYKTLKPYIRHVHVKDAKLVDAKLQYTLTGEGEMPLAEAIRLLRAGGYEGYYSFEWEKMWHPDLPDPEIALPHYPKAMNAYF